MDARIGDELLSQERWAGLRAKLEALRGRSPADPEAAYTAYGEATDLLLALHRKVRESSGLVRDPAVGLLLPPGQRRPRSCPRRWWPPAGSPTWAR